MISDVDSVFSDLGTDGSLSGMLDDKNFEAQDTSSEVMQVCTEDSLCPVNEQKKKRDDLELFMNVSLSSFASQA